MDDEQQLDRLFHAYGEACVPVDGGDDFVLRVWERIDAKRSFIFNFQRFARILVTGGAAACLGLAALNLMPNPTIADQSAHFASYADVLTAETTVERTYVSDTPRSEIDIPPQLRY